MGANSLTSPVRTPADRARQVQRVLVIVLALNLLVSVLKLMVGFTTGALAVVADGFHSIVDSSSNIIGLAGMVAASRPADANHPYGHRRYESIASMAIGAMLLAAGAEVVRSIVDRLAGGAPPNVTPLSFAIILFTLPVNALVTRYESRAAKRYSSEILAADAAHTRTDIFITLSVLASLLGSLAGVPWLDLVVAAGVVIFILRAAVGIFRMSSLALSDSAVANPDQVQHIAEGVPGVWYVHRVRSRGTADAIQLDLHVKVHPGMPTSQAHGIASEVERRLAEQMPNVVDTVVHIEPGRLRQPTEWETLSTGLRELADGRGLGLHDLHVHVEPDGTYTAEFHLEFDAGCTLGQAHAHADELEAEAKKRWPQIATVISHLEPLPTDLPGELGGLALSASLEHRVKEIAESVAGPHRCHEIRIHNVDGHLSAALHVTLPEDLPLSTAHAKAEIIERQILSTLPSLDRVVVHVEPPGE